MNRDLFAKETRMPLTRSAGILLHPTSLPGPHGTGDLGPAAYRFVDFLEAAGVGLWQVLPLGPTGFNHSPYQTLSVFAGNPLLISLEALVEERLLTAADLRSSRIFAPHQADFNAARELKNAALRRAHAAFNAGESSVRMRDEFAEFRARETGWLADFALFMALKGRHAGQAWMEWPAKLASREPTALDLAARELAGEAEYHAFVQFVFFRQWKKLKDYAAARQVRLVGDIPIYPAHDGADVWAAQEYFALDRSGRAELMAGVPPDYFSPVGQLWGNPVYRWEAMRKNNYAWWVTRFKANLQLVDVLRIDHFRGFEAYWEVPQGEKNAVNGRWIKGPGEALFTVLRRELGDLPIMAEDLGVITPEVDALREGLGLPGMKILQFAFCDGAEKYLPHTYSPNCVVYTATHDNDTTRGWYLAEGPDYAHMDRDAIGRERDRARRYLGRDGADIAWDLIRLALGSVADTAIFPLQDALNLGNDCRMNRPGIAAGPWSWRVTPEQLAAAPAGALRDMCELYGRRPQPPAA